MRLSTIKKPIPSAKQELYRDSTWEPTGGKVDGAIRLDGVDDCIVASFVVDRAEGPFSVLAWIKGGAPGQVIIAQQVIANWLMVDVEGKLMTELKGLGSESSYLGSETVITNGQ